MKKPRLGRALSPPRPGPTRVLLVVVVIVCLVQIGWWIYFQLDDSQQDLGRELRAEALARDLVAAHWRADPPADAAAAHQRLAAESPSLELVDRSLDRGVEVVLGDGSRARVALRAEHLAELRRRADSRRRMAISEGGFLGAAALAGVVSIYWLLGRELARHRQQNRLLTAVTHDFRSPLTALGLHVQTLERDKVGAEDRQRSFRALRANLTRLSDLVENVLDTARLQDGRLELRPERFDLSEAVGRRLDERADYLQHRDVVVERHLEQGAEVSVDPFLLGSVLDNLVENAVKFSTPPARLEVSVRRQGTKIELAVKDHGCGFDPRSTKQLFERFERGDQETDRARPGLGLGLALVREIVQASGGSLDAASEGPGKGSTFWVRFESAGAGP